MKQIHLVIRRINPALKIDLVQIGCLLDGQFKDLPLSDFENSLIPSFVVLVGFGQSFYSSFGHLRSSSWIIVVSWLFCRVFDNTLVLMFDFNLDSHEITSKEEGKGN